MIFGERAVIFRTCLSNLINGSGWRSLLSSPPPRKHFARSPHPSLGPAPAADPRQPTSQGLMAGAQWPDQASDPGRWGQAACPIQSSACFLTQSSSCQRTNRFIENMEMDGESPLPAFPITKYQGERPAGAHAGPARHTDLIYPPFLMRNKCRGCEYFTIKTLALPCLILNTTYNSAGFMLCFTVSNG